MVIQKILVKRVSQIQIQHTVNPDDLCNQIRRHYLPVCTRYSWAQWETTAWDTQRASKSDPIASCKLWRLFNDDVRRSPIWDNPNGSDQNERAGVSLHDAELKVLPHHQRSRKIPNASSFQYRRRHFHDLREQTADLDATKRDPRALAHLTHSTRRMCRRTLAPAG